MPELESLIKTIVGEAKVIAEAPRAFVLCVAAVAGGLWYILQWRYSGTIDHLEERIKLREDQVADYRAR